MAKERHNTFNMIEKMTSLLTLGAIHKQSGAVAHYILCYCSVDVAFGFLVTGLTTCFTQNFEFSVGNLQCFIFHKEC